MIRPELRSLKIVTRIFKAQLEVKKTGKCLFAAHFLDYMLFRCHRQ
jgi:hypothetical protein